MTSRWLSTLLIRTVIAFVVAVVVLTLVGWSWLGAGAVGLVGAAALIQLGGVVYLRRSETGSGRPARQRARR